MKLLNNKNFQILNLIIFILLISTTYVCISFYYSKDLAKTSAKKILKTTWVKINQDCKENKNMSCIKNKVNEIKKINLVLENLECYFCYGNHKINLNVYKPQYVDKNIYKLGLEKSNNKLKKRQQKSSEKFKFLTIPTFNKNYFSFIEIKDLNRVTIGYLFISYNQINILYNIISKLIIFIIFPSIFLMSLVKNQKTSAQNVFTLTLGSRFFGLFFFIGIIIYRFIIEFFYLDHFSYINQNFNKWIHNMINLNKNIEFLLYILFLIIIFIGTIFLLKSIKETGLNKKSFSTFIINCLQFFSIVFCIYRINNEVDITFLEVLVYIITFGASIIKFDNEDDKSVKS